MPSNELNPAAVQVVLAEFKDPETGRSVVDLDQVSNVRLDPAAKSLSLTLALTTLFGPSMERNSSRFSGATPPTVAGAERRASQLGGPSAPAAKARPAWA